MDDLYISISYIPILCKGWISCPTQMKIVRAGFKPKKQISQNQVPYEEGVA